MKTVLIVDDEPAIARTLGPVLVAENYSVDTAENAAVALRCVRQTCYDIVLLDLGLPDADGKEIIGQFRAMNCKAIIILSARYEESEKVAALDNGADDYLDKPFGIGELMARIRVAARRYEKPMTGEDFLKSGGFQMDFGARKVVKDGREIKLSPKEYALLECLCRHAGKIVTRRQLLIAGWNDPTQSHQNLRVYMTLVRQKLEDDKSAPKLIVTESGVGYRFVADAV